jgi:hypothetical protein
MRTRKVYVFSSRARARQLGSPRLVQFISQPFTSEGHRRRAHLGGGFLIAETSRSLIFPVLALEPATGLILSLLSMAFPALLLDTSSVRQRGSKTQGIDSVFTTIAQARIELRRGVDHGLVHAAHVRESAPRNTPPPRSRKSAGWR